MPTRRLQEQRAYGAPTGRKYYRLPLPHGMASLYVAAYGDGQRVWVGSPTTLCIGDRDDGLPVHILGVKEVRGARCHTFWQVMFPAALSVGMRKGEEVNVTRSGRTIRLKFGRAIFDPRGQLGVDPGGNQSKPSSDPHPYTQA